MRMDIDHAGHQVVALDVDDFVSVGDVARADAFYPAVVDEDRDIFGDALVDAIEKIGVGQRIGAVIGARRDHDHRSREHGE